MNIMETIDHLKKIKKRFGNLTIVGGFITDDGGLNNILVVDVEGLEVFPNDPYNVKYKNKIDGVFLS